MSLENIRRKKIRDEERWSVRQSVSCALLTKKKEKSIKITYDFTLMHDA